MRDDEKQDLGRSVSQQPRPSESITEAATAKEAIERKPASVTPSADVESATAAAAVAAPPAETSTPKAEAEEPRPASVTPPVHVESTTAAGAVTAHPAGESMTIDLSNISDAFFNAIRTFTTPMPIKDAWSVGDDPRERKPRFIIEILKQQYDETVDSAGEKITRFKDFPPSAGQSLACKTRLAEGAPAENQIVTVTQKTRLTFLVRHQFYTSHSGLEMGSMMNDQALIEKETDLFIKFYIRVDPQLKQDRKFSLIRYSKTELAHIGKLFPNLTKPTDDQQKQINEFVLKSLFKKLSDLYSQIISPQLSFFGAGPASAAPATAAPPKDDETPKTDPARLRK